ncbi:MAG: hypothetical protein QXU99_03890 [Candidatus Bathyarchaeia archaeon]
MPATIEKGNNETVILFINNQIIYRPEQFTSKNVGGMNLKTEKNPENQAVEKANPTKQGLKPTTFLFAY